MDITQQLHNHDLRATRSRVEILKLFNQERAWTAKQLHEAVDATNLSTVYRNLQALEDAGLIRKIHAHEDEAYYERGEGGHHDHLNCNDCNILECIPCPTPQLPKHELEIEGTCSFCN
jgi:Fur family ferric uptake transcriptional regulator